MMLQNANYLISSRMCDCYFIDVGSLWRQHFMLCGLSQLLIYTYLFCFVHVMLTWFDEISCLLVSI